MDMSELKEITLQTLAKSAEMRAAMGAPNDALAKAWVQAGSAISGITAYDLEAPAKLLFPVLTPLRNRIPRVSGKGGIQANWRAVTGVNTANLGIGISEGKRGGVSTDTTADYIAVYKELGLEQNVTFKADRAAVGFEDLKALAVSNLLKATMIEEERLVDRHGRAHAGLPLGVRLRRAGVLPEDRIADRALEVVQEVERRDRQTGVAHQTGLERRAVLLDRQEDRSGRVLGAIEARQGAEAGAERLDAVAAPEGVDRPDESRAAQRRVVEDLADRLLDRGLPILQAHLGACPGHRQGPCLHRVPPAAMLTASPRGVNRRGDGPCAAQCQIALTIS